MWQGGGFFSQEAAIPYNNELNEDGTGSGGLCMWLNSRMFHLLSNSCHSSGGNALWIKLQGIQNQDIGILNVYAPHTQRERCALWSKLLACLPQDCNWILTGDWNFVERREDKSNLRDPNMTEEEHRIFGELKSTLRVEDRFPPGSWIKFSWENRRDGTCMLARLDRTYLFTDEGAPPSKSDYKILGNNALSDHLPVWRHVELAPES